MRVSNKGRLIHINPPRTGTVLIDRAMRQAFDDVWKPRLHAGHDTIWKKEWEQYFVFISIRHPFTRAVSIWQRLTQNIKSRSKSWKHTLQNGAISFHDLVAHQAEEVIGYWGWMLCSSFHDRVPRQLNHVVRLECVKGDLAVVPGLGKQRNHRRQNGSRYARPWHENYTSKETIETVMRLFENDFSRYNYNTNFDEVVQGKMFNDSVRGT